MDPEKNKRLFKQYADEMSSITTYISLVIIYCNIIISSNIIGILFRDASGFFLAFEYLTILIFSAPMIIALVVAYGFAKESLFILLHDIDIDKDDSELPLRLAIYCGNLVFVIVISVFVSYQSNELLQKSAPGIQLAIRNFIGR